MSSSGGSRLSCWSAVIVKTRIITGQVFYSTHMMDGEEQHERVGNPDDQPPPTHIMYSA